ncbi:MAG: peptidylprolyl isomerase [Oscillospiraceae bacterium]
MSKQLNLLIISSCVLLAGCANSNNTSNSKQPVTAQIQSNISESEIEKGGEIFLMQFSELKEGDTIATIQTSLGNITIRLFPEYAPKACENFTSLAKNGYYNGITFHRVIDDFMIQAGDPTATGAGGESIWNKPFEDEFTPNLRNFRGALSMANCGPNTNGSQFFIVQADKKATENIANSPFSQTIPAKTLEKYIEVGGTPWLDDHHTVFGQVIDGLDIVDKIAAVKTDANSKPIDDVTIEKIEISIYTKS